MKLNTCLSILGIPLNANFVYYVAMKKLSTIKTLIVGGLFSLSMANGTNAQEAKAPLYKNFVPVAISADFINVKEVGDVHHWTYFTRETELPGIANRAVPSLVGIHNNLNEFNNEGMTFEIYNDTSYKTHEGAGVLAKVRERLQPIITQTDVRDGDVILRPIFNTSVNTNAATKTLIPERTRVGHDGLIRTTNNTSMLGKYAPYSVNNYFDAKDNMKPFMSEWKWRVSQLKFESNKGFKGVVNNVLSAVGKVTSEVWPYYLRYTNSFGVTAVKNIK